MPRLKYFLFGSVALIYCIAFGVPAKPQETPTSAFGHWINRNGWVIETGPCAEGICGTIVGMRQGAERFDIHNPDENLKRRTMCGIRIFGGFKPSGTTGEWEDGWIYDPQNGKTYSSIMKLGDGDTLEVRGFVLTPMFGRTIVLTRVPEPAQPCGTNADAGPQEPATGEPLP